MLKLFSLKQERQKQGDNESAGTGQKASAAELRMQKDVADLQLEPCCAIHFPNPNDLLHFKITITPKEGFYRDGHFVFNYEIPENYPHAPPKVYHPNIDTNGNVCLNILREEWKPVLSINSTLFGLQFLFSEPNPDDPLNSEAADCLRKDQREFERRVRKAMLGGSIDGITFARVM